MILFISDTEIEINQKKAVKTAFIYLLISIFCALFGAVYEIFSHEVYSYYMLYAFAFPLIGGTLMFNVLGLLKLRRYPNIIARNLYHSGLSTLTVGSIICGVLDIYGTSNVLSCYYWKAGIMLLILGLIAGLIDILFPIKENSDEE